MTGEKKAGLYRKIHFYRVRQNDEGEMVLVEIIHEDNTAHEVKGSKQPLTDELWDQLITWQ